MSARVLPSRCVVVPNGPWRSQSGDDEARETTGELSFDRRHEPPATFAEEDHATHEPLVVALLTAWMEDRLSRKQPIEILARILGGAFAEAGAAITASKDPTAARVAAGKLLLAWLKSLRPG